MISSFPRRFWTTWTAVAPDPVLTFRTNATSLVSRTAHHDRQITRSKSRGRSGGATVHQVRPDARGRRVRDCRLGRLIQQPAPPRDAGDAHPDRVREVPL